MLIFTRLKIYGVITLLVDDTLTHKRGKSVWGLGWFRDAVASTKKRVATASGHNWVVLAVAVCVPFTQVPILALPLLARLHLPGKGQASCADLAREMLGEVLAWWPQRRFVLVADGAYATQVLLGNLDERVSFVGRLRGDAALYDPRVPKAKKGQRGPEGQEGFEAAEAEGGGDESGPQTHDERRLGLAGRGRGGVWLRAVAESVGLRGGVADRIGLSSDPGNRGA